MNEHTIHRLAAAHHADPTQESAEALARALLRIGSWKRRSVERRLERSHRVNACLVPWTFPPRYTVHSCHLNDRHRQCTDHNIILPDEDP